MRYKTLYVSLLALSLAANVTAQRTNSNAAAKPLKNIVRYNLSGALIFGFDDYVVFGYERTLSPKRSFSVNVGRVSLPQIIAVATDSFSLQREQKRTGFNVSADFRFYLAKENKFGAPHGVYIGPYYSYNHFENNRGWVRKNNVATNEITTASTFNIHTLGAEAGYQFILWNRLAVDMIMVGPGVGFYNYKASFGGSITLDDASKKQLLEALKQVLVQKFPGMNTVFSKKEFEANGVLKTSDIGYRYLVHIGYCF